MSEVGKTLLFASVLLMSSLSFANPNRELDQVQSVRSLQADFKLEISSYDTGDFSDESSLESEGPQFVDSSASDSEIIKAVSSRRRVHFVEGGSMVVTKLLPDDNQGLKHQKWMVRLTNGQSMQAVYNTDMCPHVPLREGDVIAMGGMFLWTNEGAMIHWLHRDPKGQRPDGYVKVNGTYYCKD